MSNDYRGIGNPHFDTVGPSFSDDWFGWTASKLEKGAEYLENKADQLGEYLFGANAQIENVVKVAEAIDRGARVLGQEPVFGTDNTQGVRDVLSGQENRANDMTRRLTELREIYRRRKILEGAPPDAYVDENGKVALPPGSPSVLPPVKQVPQKTKSGTPWRVIR